MMCCFVIQSWTVCYKVTRKRGHPAPRGARQPDGTQPPLWDEKDLPSVLALFRLAYDLAADNTDDGS
jgi:hypothetical protein